MLPPPVLDPQNKIPGRVEHGLDGGLALAGVDEAGGEEFLSEGGAGVLEADLAAVVTGDDAEAAGPDLVGLKPLAALVAARCGPGRDLEDGDLADDEESVLERFFVFFDRHWGAVVRRSEFWFGEE